MDRQRFCCRRCSDEWFQAERRQVVEWFRAEGRAVEVKNIQELASMPSKEELIAKVMFLINSSAQRLAVSLAGVARNLAVVIDQAAKEGKFAS